ncbi:MAG: hypothetical protein AMJ42_01405 [Deltaproteobacteria bacterium DG_8]|nr:MAG: hypothetical protein AMJ42_01405 [Deltaproteobacteria bacterium DG_8]
MKSAMKVFGFSFSSSSQKKLMNELSEYYKIAEEHPEDSRVHLRIAEVLMKMGRKGKAIEEYIYAAERYEDNNLSQVSAAIYKQILQIDPNQINVYQTLVDVYLKEGFLGDAVATYERLAGHYYNRGMRDEALKTLEKMVAIGPQSVYIKNKVDRLYSEMNLQAEETESPVENWELFDPVTSGEKRDRKLLNRRRGEFYDLAAELQDDFLSEEDVAQELEEIGDGEGDRELGFDEIFNEIRHFESEGIEQDSSLFHYNLGTAFQKVGRFDEAIDELKKALEDPKKRADCYLRLAICSREKNFVKEAIKYLKKGLRTGGLSESKMLELKYELALAYKTKGKKKKSLKIFKQIHEISSNFREVIKELAEVSQ